jgi:hypothetical protein
VANIARRLAAALALAALLLSPALLNGSMADATSSAADDVFTRDELAVLGVRALKDVLASRGVDHSDCVEKGDLVAKATGLPKIVAPEKNTAEKLLESGAHRGRVAGVDCISLVSDNNSDDCALLVLVLHGFGASAEDLFPISQQVLGEAGRGVDGRVCFVHPQGILDLGGGSRAWWNIDMQELMGHVMKGDADALFVKPPDGLSEARDAVMGLLKELVKKCLFLFFLQAAVS